MTPLCQVHCCPEAPYLLPELWRGWEGIFTALQPDLEFISHLWVFLLIVVYQVTDPGVAFVVTVWHDAVVKLVASPYGVS